jgi:hypothetical protein
VTVLNHKGDAVAHPALTESRQQSLTLARLLASLGCRPARKAASSNARSGVAQPGAATAREQCRESSVMKRRDSGIDEDEEAAKVMTRRYRAMLGYDDAVADPYEHWVEDAALLRLSKGRPYQRGNTGLVLPV